MTSVKHLDRIKWRIDQIIKAKVIKGGKTYRSLNRLSELVEALSGQEMINETKSGNQD